jgi:REP element-mobilizing transposase RayT
MSNIYESGHYYHVYNRGMSKQQIFFEKSDKSFLLKRASELQLGLNGHHDVSLATYCLMDNHYHFLLRQESEGGVSRYMQRLGTSYMMRWNKKYECSGRLFQGPCKVKRIDSEAYLVHLIRYIHMNPLGISARTALARGSLTQSIAYLRKYEWSDCKKYLAGNGILSDLFLPLSYEIFLSQWMLWPVDSLFQGDA